MDGRGRQEPPRGLPTFGDLTSGDRRFSEGEDSDSTFARADDDEVVLREVPTFGDPCFSQCEDGDFTLALAPGQYPPDGANDEEAMLQEVLASPRVQQLLQTQVRMAVKDVLGDVVKRVQRMERDITERTDQLGMKMEKTLREMRPSPRSQSGRDWSPHQRLAGVFPERARPTSTRYAWPQQRDVQPVAPSPRASGRVALDTRGGGPQRREDGRQDGERHSEPQLSGQRGRAGANRPEQRWRATPTMDDIMERQLEHFLNGIDDDVARHRRFEETEDRWRPRLAEERGSDSSGLFAGMFSRLRGQRRLSDAYSSAEQTAPAARAAPEQRTSGDRFRSFVGWGAGHRRRSE